jgi:hypothetical protein
MTITTKSASDSAAGALRALSMLARHEDQMSTMVAALQALTGPAGPLAELVSLTDKAADWLADFEHADADADADRLNGAGRSIAAALEQLTTALPLLRPLAD